MKSSDLFENIFTRYKKYLKEEFKESYTLREKVEDKLYSEKNIQKNIDYDYLEDQIETELFKLGIKENLRLKKEVKNILYIYAEDKNVKYDTIFNKIIPLAAKYLSLQPHFTLSGVDDLDSLINLVMEGNNVYTKRNSFYGYYVDILPEGKLLLELDKKLYNDRFAPYGFKFTHFLIKLEDMMGEPLNKFEVGNLIKLYIKDNSLNYDNFFNKFVPEAKKYLKIRNNSLSEFKSYEDFKRKYNEYF